MEIDTFKAISHPFRKHIIEQLAAGERHTTADLAAGFDMTKAAVSQHLKLLRETRMVIEEKSGRTKYYRLNPATIRELLAWAETFQLFWSDKMTSLNDYLERSHQTPDKPQQE